MNEQKETAAERLAEEVTNDFLRRQEERRLTERGWQLNLNFVRGNQYCDINSKGEIFEEDKKYYWQSRRVFNHVAATVDLRCSKLGRIRPALIVTAASNEESDRQSAILASAILSSVSEGQTSTGLYRTRRSGRRRAARRFIRLYGTAMPARRWVRTRTADGLDKARRIFRWYRPLKFTPTRCRSKTWTNSPA